jgi:hypothetical protein
MAPVTDRSTFVALYAGRAPWDIVRAICELDGDTLKQCRAVERERPRAVDPKPGPGVNYSVYKRVKK